MGGVQDPKLKEEPGHASLKSPNHAPGVLVLGHSGDFMQQLDSGDDSGTSELCPLSAGWVLARGMLRHSTIIWKK